MKTISMLSRDDICNILTKSILEETGADVVNIQFKGNASTGIEATAEIGVAQSPWPEPKPRKPRGSKADKTVVSKMKSASA